MGRMRLKEVKERRRSVSGKRWEGECVRRRGEEGVSVYRSGRKDVGVGKEKNERS